MKLKATLLLLMLAQFSFGQQKWAFHTSAEETIMFGDQRSSLNFANLNTPAANAGMRAGIYRNVNELFAVEATLGVVGSGNTTFSTRIIPVEVIGHYDILPIVVADAKEGMKFNVDFGVGSALVRAQSTSYNTSGRFSFSENLSLGASLDLSVLPNGVLTFGYRHTMFVDDFIDNLAIIYRYILAGKKNQLTNIKEELYKYWDEGEIVEMLGVISLFGYLNRWNDSMGTTLEEDAIESGHQYLGKHGFEVGKHNGSKY